ncbi:MAG: hypothetical protein HY558_05760 [Euryarchaeota archaeon]|nr:hypothetical protein [Euryarchaeota archaeon]
MRLLLPVLLLFLASGPALAHFGEYPVEEEPTLLLAAGGSLALLGALLFLKPRWARELRDDARFALRRVAAQYRRFLLLALGMAAFATGFNLLLLAAVTGHLPDAARLGGADLDPELLSLEPAVSRFDAPLFWVEYPQWFDAANDPAGAYRGMFPRARIPLRWSFTPHYLTDMVPLVALLAAYMVLSQKFSRQRKFLKGAAALPGAGSASTALTGLAASACCGAVTVGQVSQVVAVAGVAIAPSSLVLPSRVFIAAMALLLVLLVLRASRRIRTCPIAAGGESP